MRRCVFGLLCITACSGGSNETCASDRECASGFCKVDGTCGPAPIDGSVDEIDASADATTALCTPNHDGVITLAELPFAAGRMATYRVATDATWNTAGQAMQSGARAWDLDIQLSGDADRLLALGTPSAQWWTNAFPTATYATEMIATPNLRGVFNVGGGTITLLGVVSPDGGTFRTELEYDPPAAMLGVPLMAGSTWSSTSTVSGYAQGAIVAYTETYQSLVDQVGTMKTPYGEFPVLRIATDLTRTSGLTTLSTKRMFTWVAECFGPVAAASSQDFASGAEFT